MAYNLFKQMGQVVKNYDPNASVEKPAELPIYKQQPVVEPGNTSASAVARRGLFRVDPTPNQAMAVGASPVSETERAAEINQLKVDAAKREAAKEPVFQTQQKKINPESSTDGMEALLYTSPQREEELRKASVQRQRIMAIGDALRHIGNIYNTVNYAPAQQFNSPVEEERQRYLKEKAVRDNNNYRYLTYQQAKAAQEQKMKQWEADYRLKVADAARKAGYTEAQIKNLQDRLEQQKSYQEAQILLGKQKAADQRAHWEKQLEQQARHQKAMEGAAYMNANTNRMRAKAYVDHLKTGGNANSMPLKTPKGSIYAPGKSVPQPQMNQLYKFAVDNGYINQSDFKKKMSEAGFGKADPDYVRNQMVAEAMMEHGELADYAHDNYGWNYGGSNVGGLLPIDGFGGDNDDLETIPGFGGN